MATLMDRGPVPLYSELKVNNGHVEGYIKPLFKDMKVYDARHDKEENPLHKLYEGLVGGVAKLLKTPRGMKSPPGQGH